MLLKVNPNPSRKELRQFGVTLIVGFALLAGLLYWRGKVHFAYILGGVGILAGLLSIVTERPAKVIYKGWMTWGSFMGTVVTRIVLTFLFFVVISPVALFFRCIGRDALRLRKGTKDSYWQDLPKITDKSYYRRLF